MGYLILEIFHLMLQAKLLLSQQIPLQSAIELTSDLLFFLLHSLQLLPLLSARSIELVVLEVTDPVEYETIELPYLSLFIFH